MRSNLKFIGSFANKNTATNFKENVKTYKTLLGEIAITEKLKVAVEGDTTLFLCGQIYCEEKPKDEAAFILKMYLQLGTKVLKKLDGEFTFIVISDNKIVIARDRHGAGSQVFYTNLFFSNNLFELTSIENFKVEPDINAFEQFLSIGYIPSPQTSLKGVKKLAGGSCLTFEKGELKEEQLFTFEEFSSHYNTLKMSESDAIAEYEYLHKSAIKTRIAGKESVGLLMSGGYDSGGNISALRNIYQGKVKTYSIGFKDNQWSELPLAAKLAKEYNSKHHEYEIDGSEILNLPSIIRFIGDPFQEGGLMLNFMAMNIIGDDKPEIILGGDGNDQLHGTAGKELALNYRVKKMKLSGLQRIFSSVANQPMFDHNNKIYRLKFHNDKIHNILKSDNFGFSSKEINRLFRAGLKTGNYAYLEYLPKHIKNFDELFMTHNFFGDIKQVINEVILFKASRMAEMYNNSLTFPYMSTDLYTFLSTVPRDLKFKGSMENLSKGRGISKYLHKSYLQPKLPTDITGRKKQGGFAPLPIFFKSEENRKLFSNIILNSDIVGEIFAQNSIREFLTKYDTEVQKPSYWFWYDQVKASKYFNLLTLAVWWEMMIHKKDISSLNDLA